MEIRTVQTKADLKAFVELPYRLYRHDPVWVAPLRDEQMGQYDPARNPMLDHCKTTLFLAEDAGKIVGRVSAFIDHLALEAWKDRFVHLLIEFTGIFAHEDKSGTRSA